MPRSTTSTLPAKRKWVALIAKAVATYGRLDILVNNAGISGSSVGDPDGLEGWHRIIALNQTSVFLGTKLAAEQMAKTGGGSIVNISSIMGLLAGSSALCRARKASLTSSGLYLPPAAPRAVSLARKTVPVLYGDPLLMNLGEYECRTQYTCMFKPSDASAWRGGQPVPGSPTN